MTGGVVPGGGLGWSPRGTAAAALERAADAVVGALRHLDAATEVPWSGRAAVRYRSALDDVVVGVLRTHLQVGRATRAVTEHAAARDLPVLLSPAEGLLRPVVPLVPGPDDWFGAP